MCRHIARIGSPVTLQSLLIARPHSLVEQASAPRHQTGGLINADGFGAGWYVEQRPEPVRYRRSQPIWSDLSFASIAEVTTSACILAAVRSATPGFPVEESCSAPFTEGRWLFSHNGVVSDIDLVMPKLADRAAQVRDARAPVDSAFLFALAVSRWRAGCTLAEGLALTVADVRAQSGGRLNLLATDGTTIAATRCGDSLFTLTSAAGVVVASEPYDDDPAWQAVPDNSLVSADLAGVTVQPMPMEPA
jgi:glutamine amidotransferase